MKKINFRFLGLFVLLLSVFSNQVVFADIIIRKDDGTGLQPNNVLSKSRTLSLSSNTFIAVTADVVGADLIVDFGTSVGTALVSVVDQNGNVVYQTSVDTFNTSEVIIPVDGLSTGKYSVKISYGSTKLIGDFNL
jgi:hypothetical protein